MLAMLVSFSKRISKFMYLISSEPLNYSKYFQKHILLNYFKNMNMYKYKYMYIILYCSVCALMLQAAKTHVGLLFSSSLQKNFHVNKVSQHVKNGLRKFSCH